MPLLEVVQTRQVSASIRLTDSTAMQIDQYATFIRASADDVVEEALKHVFAKDRDFQDFLKTPQAKQATPTLRIRKGSAAEASEPSPRKSTTGAQPATSASPAAAGLKA
jgi:predicted transcriptional regulator